ncbi:MAG: GGDEF domain-containing protein [Lachnospiraceae bacterium]|nr:GGDEF domain-containing protein [Lachnospiraceae bacterium]
MKKRVTRKKLILTAIVGGILLMLMVVVHTIMSSRQMISATDEAVSEVSSFYLEAMADRRSKTVTNLIDGNFDHMEKAVEFIEAQGIGSLEELRQTIGNIKSLLSLDRFALVDEDNIVYTRYTTYTGGSRHSFLSGGEMKDRKISTVSIYGSSKQLCLAAPTPGLKIAGKPYKACFVQIDFREIVDLLAFEDEGRTYFGLYNKNGENLSDTELGPYVSKHNLFEKMRGVIPEEEWNANHDNFTNAVDGSVSFTVNGVAETLCYVPVEETDWMMVVLIRESVIHDRIRGISEKSQKLSQNQIAFTLLFSAIFFVVLLLMFKDMSNRQLEEEKENTKAFRNMANTDSMTGVRNKHAYSDAEAYLNRQIRENEIEKLAVIVCDVNGLKHVNDTKGHAAGDQLIKDASAMICEHFVHGAVYRIGGDEFTVILKDKGYDTMQDVLGEINRVVEENIAKDEVVISIGYSTLTPEDKLLHDVFERADQMMYERKKQLKAMGAKTRSDS